MVDKPKISVCIATYNEEANIKRCLKSVYSWVDEVIIVDGRSADKTVKFAKAFGSKVRVYTEENPAMFHINKQKAIEKARGEWILQLDADEQVSSSLKEEILTLVKNHKEQVLNTGTVAYWIPRLNFFLGRPLKKGGQYPDYTIRLYKKGVAKFPCKTIHEQVEVKGGVGYLTGILLHYPYPDFWEYLKKWDRYCELEAELLLQNKVRPSFGLFIQYFCLKPLLWFLMTYFRHKGFMDGFSGFVFSYFSALRFNAIYIKLYEKFNEK